MVKTDHQQICDLTDIFIFDFYNQNLEPKHSIWIVIMPIFTQYEYNRWGPLVTNFQALNIAKKRYWIVHLIVVNMMVNQIINRYAIQQIFLFKLLQPKIGDVIFLNYEYNRWDQLVINFQALKHSQKKYWIVHLIVVNMIVKTDHQQIRDLVDFSILNFHNQNVELKHRVWM